jgi:hypothetical protein
VSHPGKANIQLGSTIFYSKKFKKGGFCNEEAEI